MLYSKNLLESMIIVLSTSLQDLLMLQVKGHLWVLKGMTVELVPETI